MNAVVIEHVKVSDRPEEWRAHFAAATRVTVRIESEAPAANVLRGADGENPLFGMWRDREDMADVACYMRDLRAPRF